MSAASECTMGDAEFFAANPGRRYRVRPWSHADAPGLPTRMRPLHEPLCSVVENGGFGPMLAASPAAFGRPAPPIANTDAAARILIQWGAEARAFYRC